MNPAQKDNSHLAAKVALRRRLVGLLSAGPAAVRVLETHAGEGRLRALCYGGLDVLSVDIRQDAPDAVHCDSRLLLRSKTLDIARFTLVDIDAYGKPWEHVWLVSQRKQRVAGELFGLVMTSGDSGQLAARNSNLRRAGWSTQMAAALGVDAATSHKWFIGRRGAERKAQGFIAAWFTGWHVERWWSICGGKGVWYFAVLLRG